MIRDELIAEISMRRDIPMDFVEEVLDEQDIIFEEEKCCKKKKRCIAMVCVFATFAIITAAVVYVLDKKQKIDMEDMLKKYIDKIKN